MQKVDSIQLNLQARIAGEEARGLEPSQKFSDLNQIPLQK